MMDLAGLQAVSDGAVDTAADGLREISLDVSEHICTHHEIATCPLSMIEDPHQSNGGQHHESFG